MWIPWLVLWLKSNASKVNDPQRKPLQMEWNCINIYSICFLELVHLNKLLIWPHCERLQKPAYILQWKLFRFTSIHALVSFFSSTPHAFLHIVFVPLTFIVISIRNSPRCESNRLDCQKLKSAMWGFCCFSALLGVLLYTVSTDTHTHTHSCGGYDRKFPAIIQLSILNVLTEKFHTYCLTHKKRVAIQNVPTLIAVFCLAQSRNESGDRSEKMCISLKQ